MDIFQLVGDMLHLFAMLALILKIRNTKSVGGLSYRTQEIYLVLFVLRYHDIFQLKGIYITVMKALFISITAYTIYLIKFKRPFLLPNSDNFKHYFLYLAALLPLVFSHSDLGHLKAYSIWLQSLAILPQLNMISKVKNVQNITGMYVFGLGMYRLLYIFHWINLYWSLDMIIWTSFIAGIIQTGLYADFFYYFLVSKQEENKFKFPM